MVSKICCQAVRSTHHRNLLASIPEQRVEYAKSLWSRERWAISVEACNPFLCELCPCPTELKNNRLCVLFDLIHNFFKLVFIDIFLHKFINFKKAKDSRKIDYYNERKFVDELSKIRSKNYDWVIHFPYHTFPICRKSNINLFF